MKRSPRYWKRKWISSTTSSRLGPIGVSKARLMTLDVGPEPLGRIGNRVQATVVYKRLIIR